jgi:N-acetylglutamate synthase-like GNAT family acetyltransferase
VRSPLRATTADAFALGAFLATAGLDATALDDPEVFLWIDLDPDGRIVASTGFELAGDRALIRSIAVAPHLRGAGRGTELAQFALDRARESGATTAWLMSRRPGSLWRELGFERADIHQLAAALLTTRQVRAFAEAGRLDYETAWTRPL